MVADDRLLQRIAGEAHRGGAACGTGDQQFHIDPRGEHVADRSDDGVDAAAGDLLDDRLAVADAIGVVAAEAAQRVDAGTAAVVECVGTGVAGDRLGKGVAGEAERRSVGRSGRFEELDLDAVAERVARPRQHLVGAAARNLIYLFAEVDEKDVVACSAVELVAAAFAAVEHVIVGATVKEVRSRPAPQLVIAPVALQHVLAAEAVEKVVPVAAQQQIVAAVGEDRVVARPAANFLDVDEGVARRLSCIELGRLEAHEQGFRRVVINPVYTVAAVEDVRAGAARQRIVVRPAPQRVVAVAAMKLVVAGFAEYQVVVVSTPEITILAGADDAVVAAAAKDRQRRKVVVVGQEVVVERRSPERRNVEGSADRTEQPAMDIGGAVAVYEDGGGPGGLGLVEPAVVQADEGELAGIACQFADDKAVAALLAGDFHVEVVVRGEGRGGRQHDRPLEVAGLQRGFKHEIERKAAEFEIAADVEKVVLRLAYVEAERIADGRVEFARDGKLADVALVVRIADIEGRCERRTDVDAEEQVAVDGAAQPRVAIEPDIGDDGAALEQAGFTLELQQAAAIGEGCAAPHIERVGHQGIADDLQRAVLDGDALRAGVFAEGDGPRAAFDQFGGFDGGVDDAVPCAGQDEAGRDADFSGAIVGNGAAVQCGRCEGEIIELDLRNGDAAGDVDRLGHHEGTGRQLREERLCVGNPELVRLGDVVGPARLRRDAGIIAVPGVLARLADPDQRLRHLRTLPILPWLRPLAAPPCTRSLRAQ